MFDLASNTRDVRSIVQAVRQLIQGRNNATGTVTLTTGTSTTITLTNGNSEAAVFFTAKNAAAAGTALHAVATDETVTITHPMSLAADREFYYIVTGG